MTEREKINTLKSIGFATLTRKATVLLVNVI